MTSKGIGISLVLAVVIAGSAGVFAAWWLSPGNMAPVGVIPVASSSEPIRAVSTDIPKLGGTPSIKTAATETATAEEPTTERALSIIAFGDSITAGYGIALDDAYPAILEKLLRERGYNVRVTNMGVSGDTARAGAQRAEFVISKKPDIVILALGGNDMLRGIDPDVTRASLSEIIAALRAKNVEIILAGMMAPRNLGDAYVREFDAIYPELAETYHVPLVPFLLDGVALDPAQNQNDGIHPTVAGQRIIAEKNILPVLEPVVERMLSETAEGQ